MAGVTTSGISSLGIGSGLDVSSIISQLMTAESQPLKLMQADATKIQTKISAYGKIQSYVSALSDAAKALADPTGWSQATATSGDDKVFTATSGTGAVAGSYSVQVNKLALGQTLVSSGFTSGSGTLSIQLGQWSDDGLTLNDKAGSSAVDVSISATDTLQDISNKINAAKAGVTASVLTDATGSKLVLRSTQTGAENAFKVTVADDDGNDSDPSGLSALAFTTADGTATMGRVQTARNTDVLVDGVPVQSASNTIEGVVAGVTLKLTGESTSATSLSVNSDTTTLQSNVQAFVKAYNDLLGYMNTQTKYDESSKTGGPLQGDSGTNNLRMAMRRLESGQSGASTMFGQLYQIGIDTNRDGTLKVDSAKLTTAMASPSELSKLFSRNGAGTDDDGFGERIKSWADSLVSFDGSVTTRTQSLQKQLDANSKKQDAFNDKLTRIQAQLQAQYATLDTTMANATSLSNYVTQQITNWNKSTA